MKQKYEINHGQKQYFGKNFTDSFYNHADDHSPVDSGHVQRVFDISRQVALARQTVYHS